MAKPDCFGWCDGYNPSCKRCTVFKDCLEHQHRTRPQCFGNGELYDPTGSCSRCLDQSFCEEEMRGKKMVTLKKHGGITLRPGSTPQQLPKKVVEEEEEEEIIGGVVEKEVAEGGAKKEALATSPMSDISDSAYFTMSIVDLRALAEQAGLDPSGRKSDVIRRLISNGAPTPKSASHTAPISTQTAAPIAVGSVQRLVLEPATWASELVERLRKGEILRIQKEESGFSVSLENVRGSTVKKEHGVKQAVNKAEVSDVERNQACFTEEYYKLRYVDAGFNGKPWNSMTHEEKRQYAERLGVTYIENHSIPIEAMRILDAVRIALRIEMYRPEYAKKSQRVAAGYW